MRNGVWETKTGEGEADTVRVQNRLHKSQEMGPAVLYSEYTNEEAWGLG